MGVGLIEEGAEMTLGTGIFLSACLLAFVALFLKTRGSWKWGKIIGWGLGSLVLLVGGGIGIALGVEAYNKRPKSITEFAGVKIGEPGEDVKFKLGKPARIWAEDDSITENWVYIRGEDMTYITFLKGEASAVSFTTTNNYSYMGLNGIEIGSPLSLVESRLGKPDFVSQSNDQLSRVFNYRKYNSAYEIKAGRVTELIALHPKIGPWQYKRPVETVAQASTSGKKSKYDALFESNPHTVRIDPMTGDRIEEWKSTPIVEPRKLRKVSEILAEEKADTNAWGDPLTK